MMHVPVVYSACQGDNRNASAILKVQGIINCNCFHGLFSIFIVIQKNDEP